MINQINVLVSGMTSNPGGVESFIINYSRNMDDKRVHFDFICYDNIPAYYQEIVKRSNVFIVPGRKKLSFLYYQIKELRKIFTKHHYDVIWHNVISLSDILLLQIAKKYNVNKRIVHAHNSQNMHSDIIHILLHEFHKRIIHFYATCFWSCSYTAGEYFYSKQIINSNNFKIINNAIDTNRFIFSQLSRDIKREKMNLKDKFVVGHIGRFHFQKNHEFLLKVFYEIHKNNPESVLLLVGDGDQYKKIEKQIETFGLVDSVQLLGIRDDIPELLHAMDIFIFPSRFEGLSVVLIEAQAASLYCFTSTAVSVETAITNKISFIDLNKTPGYWADLVLQKKDYPRDTTYEEIKSKGYDIKAAASKVEEYF